MTRTTGPAALDGPRRRLLLLAPWLVAASLALVAAARLMLATPADALPGATFLAPAAPSGSETPATGPSGPPTPTGIAQAGPASSVGDDPLATVSPGMTAEVLRLARQTVRGPSGQRWALDLTIVDMRRVADDRAVVTVHGTAITHDGSDWGQPASIGVAVAVTTGRPGAQDDPQAVLHVGPAWPVAVPTTAATRPDTPAAEAVTDEATLALAVDAVLAAGFVADDVSAVRRLSYDLFEVVLHGTAPGAPESGIWTAWLIATPDGLRVAGAPVAHGIATSQPHPTPTPDSNPEAKPESTSTPQPETT